jgi:hypothetical protein
MPHALLTLAIAMVAASTAAGAGLIKLTFAPDPKRDVLQHLTTRTITRVVGEPARREVLQKSVTRIRHERAGKGWRMLATAVSSRTSRDGLEVSDPMSQALIGRTIVYVLGPQAEVQSIEGFAEAIRAALDSLPPESRDAVAATLDIEALRRREARDFEARITEWAGVEAEPGTEVPYQDVAPLPSGALVMHARTRVGPVETADGRPRVTIRTAFDTDSLALLPLFRQVIAGGNPEAQLDSLPAESPRVIGFSVRVVDPTTLQILSEQSTRVMHMRIQAPGRGDAMVARSERREWRFETVGSSAR